MEYRKIITDNFMERFHILKQFNDRIRLGRDSLDDFSFETYKENEILISVLEKHEEFYWNYICVIPKNQIKSFLREKDTNCLYGNGKLMHHYSFRFIVKHKENKINLTYIDETDIHLYFSDKVKFKILDEKDKHYLKLLDELFLGDANENTFSQFINSITK